jgi:ERF superfamily
MSSTHTDPQSVAMGQPEAQTLLYAKMSKVLAAVQRVPKNGVNSHFGYRFVREADLTEAIRQHMAEHNLCLFVGATDVLDTRPTEGKAGPVTTIRMTATFACGDGGATFTTSWLGAGQDAGDKGLYKALTGGVKYLLMKTFMVSSNDDPEQEEAPGEAARAESHPAGPRPRKKKPL